MTDIIVTTIISFVVLLLLSKLNGNRQIGELTLFDYITSITIGSIAAEAAIGGFDEMWEPMLAMTVYALLTLAVSLLCSKSLTMRRLISGKSYILLDNGKLFYENFKKARLDVNEFLSACRCAGYRSPAELQSVIMEPSGRLSFIPLERIRPVTCEDMQLEPQQKKLITVVISDGKVLRDNLKRAGRNENALNKDLERQKLKPEEILLAFYDGGSFTAYTRDCEKIINEAQQ